ncbi:MAG: hypothetical protein WEC75_07335 [Dehalococcoidia bacterium]
MTADPRPESVVCAVCGGPTDPRMSAECNWCDRRYHLNMRNDVESQDCGAVWIDEQYLALQFACNDCLSGGAAPAPPGRAASTPRPTPAARPRRYKRRA